MRFALASEFFLWEHRDVAHPINPAAREKIQNAILEVYNNTPEPEAKPAEETPAAE